MTLELKNSVSMFYQSTTEKYLNMTPEELVKICKEVKDERVYNLSFGALYFKVANLVFSAYSKYKDIINENDAISILTTSMLEAIQNYKLGSKAKFSTFLYSHFKLMLINEFVALNTAKRKLNNNTRSLELITNNLPYSYEQKMIDLKLSIDIDNKLNPLQKRVFRLLLNGYTMEQIRKKLKISIEKLRAIKQSLKDGFLLENYL